MKKQSLLTIGSLISIIIFVAISLFVALNPINQFDLQVAGYLTSYTSPTLDWIMIRISWFGEVIPATILIIALCFWIYHKFGKRGTLLIALTIVFALTADLFKIVIARPRPELIFFQDYTRPFTFSFPSGHVTFYTFYFGFLAFLALTQPFVNKLEKILFISVSLPLILLVGVSRIYLGVHWPTDVLGGYILGFFLLKSFIFIFLHIKQPTRKQVQQENL